MIEILLGKVGGIFWGGVFVGVFATLLVQEIARNLTWPKGSARRRL